MKRFITPAFVRVENPAERKELIEWLEGVEYRIRRNADKPLIITHLGVAYIGGCPCSTKDHYDCGTNVALFRALAAMNDSNDREQRFVEDIRKLCGIGGQTVGLEPTRKVGEKWFKYENNDLQVTNHIAFEKENSYHRRCLIRKATAEEIIKHFKIQKA